MFPFSFCLATYHNKKSEWTERKEEGAWDWVLG